MFEAGLRYSVEFIKLILVVVCILNIPVKKRINYIFGLFLVGITILSYWIDLANYSLECSIVIFGIFLVSLYQKRNIGFVILSYTIISIVDMLFGLICVNLFSLTSRQLLENSLIITAINSISLVIIIILSFIISKSRKKPVEYKLSVYFPVMLLGGLFVSLYLSTTQLLKLGMVTKKYPTLLFISSVVISVVYFILCYSLAKNQAKNRLLKVENDMSQRLLKTQNEYYTMMLKKEKETRMFRHDIKEHVMCMQMLYEQNKYDELGEYLKQMGSYTKDLSPKSQAGNSYIDMIVTELMEQYPDVVLEWIGKVPPLTISSMDMCTLFSNLLKNSFETAHKISEKKVNVEVKTQGYNLLLVVSNRYERLEIDENNQYISTKQEEGHGYGIKNIEKCIEQYSGSYIVTTEGNVFRTEVILPDVISE